MSVHEVEGVCRSLYSLSGRTEQGAAKNIFWATDDDGGAGFTAVGHGMRNGVDERKYCVMQESGGKVVEMQQKKRSGSYRQRGNVRTGDVSQGCQQKIGSTTADMRETRHLGTQWSYWPISLFEGQETEDMRVDLSVKREEDLLKQVNMIYWKNWMSNTSARRWKKEFDRIQFRICYEEKLMKSGQISIVIWCVSLLWKEIGCRKDSMISNGQTKRDVKDETKKKTRTLTD